MVLNQEYKLNIESLIKQQQDKISSQRQSVQNKLTDADPEVLEKEEQQIKGYIQEVSQLRRHSSPEREASSVS